MHKGNLANGYRTQVLQHFPWGKTRGRKTNLKDLIKAALLESKTKAGKIKKRRTGKRKKIEYQNQPKRDLT